MLPVVEHQSAQLPPPLAVAQPIVAPAAAPAIARPAGLVEGSLQGTMALAIIMAYLCLGLALAWGFQQSRQQQIAKAHTEQERLAADRILAQQDDLGRFLAQHATISIPLTGATGGPVPSATVAWNKDRGDGVLFCDGLEKLLPPRTCQLWFKSPTGTACAARVDPIAGQDIYRFHIDGPDVDPSEIILTRGTPAADFAHIDSTAVLARGGRTGSSAN
jgi:hypothetical protein